MKKHILFSLLLFSLVGCFIISCESPSFQAIGEFSIKRLPSGYIEITDGIGRRFALVPKGVDVPSGFPKSHIISIPVKKVVVYSAYNVSLLRGLGVLSSVVGVTQEEKKWTIKKIQQGLKNGSITYLGPSTSIDYEKLKEINPQVVFTWNLADIPVLEDMGIPAVVTTTKEAMDLTTRMKFMLFLSTFFEREAQAQKFISRVKKTIEEVHQRINKIKHKPKVIWGDIYEKRVLVEPGNSWAAQIVEIAGGDYLFKDIKGAS